MKPRVYIETTIPSYLTSRPHPNLIIAAHQQITQTWWEVRRKHFGLFVSPFVVEEAGDGDEEAARKRLAVLDGIPQLVVTDAAERLAAVLLTKGAIPKTVATDAAHVAVATVHRMDYLLTWNCKHLANASRMKN